ncbi:hypothetical protein [Cohnella soli]|uniref:Butirosin biosynthesis protein H N-terminal domain-containing protein n=1 Tax=Cohnella soli TaxID=425005 RepID=A0ABW0I7R2_9BACL
MQRHKILEPFSPFNEIYFRNCFYNALFPVIRHFGRTEDCYILNESHSYEMDEETYQIYHATKYLRSDQELLEYINIAGPRLDLRDNVVSRIVQAIDDGHPVIVFVDCFYLSIRPDTFHKLHCLHSLLIHGYDTERQLFHIIEHEYRDSYLYEKRNVPFQDIVVSCQNIHDSLNWGNDLPIGQEYYLRDPQQIFDRERSQLGLRARYIESALSGMAEQMDALKVLASFGCLLESVVLEETKLQVYLEGNFDLLFQRLTDIINNHVVRKYQIRKVFQDTVFIADLDQIINDWQLIRSVFGKYQYSSFYQPRSFQFLLRKLEEAAEVERRFLGNYQRFLQQWGS